MNTAWRWALIGLLAAAGCGPASPATPATLVAVATLAGSPSAPAPDPAPSAAAPPQPQSALTVWLPAQFSPAGDPLGGPVLASQLDAYAREHPGLAVQIRAKAAAGPGGLLDSLLATYNAAPEALPDLVALSRSDLEAAVAAGVIIPLEGRLPADTLQAAYPVAQALSRVDGQWVGAPFAVDARLLVYNASLYAEAPARWADVLTGTLIVPGADPAGLTVLTDYLASGPLDRAGGQAQLDPARLAPRLEAWLALAQSQTLPASTLTYADPAETWQVFRERRADLALTSVSWYLREAARAPRAGAALPPNTLGTAFTLADGWSWALINKAGDRAAAAQLLNWLIAPERQAAWTQAAGILPAQPAALAGWAGSPFSPIAAEVLTHAELQPSAADLARLGPALRLALDDVLSGQATPEAAAQAAASALAGGQP